MKRLSLILLLGLVSLTLVIGFTACGSDADQAKETAKTKQVEKAKPAAKAAEAKPAETAQAKSADKAGETKPAAKAGQDKTAKPEYPAGLETQEKRIAYVLGHNLGKRMARDELKIDIDAFALGVKDGSTNSPSKLTEEQIKAALTVFSKQMAAKAQAKKEAEAKITRAEGDKFRAEYAKKKGVKTTPSGLMYRVLKSGSGPSPTLEDKVTTHYKGSTIDGKVFDSSYKRGKPATFPVKGVIKGWQEILPLMKVGDKFEVVIPPELGYGAQGAGQIIKPYSTLVFEIELKKIGEPEPADKTKAGELKTQSSNKGWKKLSDNDKAAQALKKALEKAEAKKKAEAEAKDKKTE